MSRLSIENLMMDRVGKDYRNGTERRVRLKTGCETM